jgi:hypothetical protein
VYDLTALLAYFLQGSEGKAVCEQIVDKLGLKRVPVKTNIPDVTVGRKVFALFTKPTERSVY